MIVKKCCICKKYFPAKLKSYIDYCPKCFEHHKNSFVDSIKHSRSISVDRFDVFDKDYPTLKSWYRYERVCRICGKRLLTKKKKYAYRRRYRSRKCSTSEIFFNWGDTRWKYIESKREGDLTLKCELCKKEIKHHQVEVHHKKPVHTLNYEQLYMIWDFDNLIMLCHECHMKQDHKRKKKITKPVVIIKTKNWKKITTFITKKNQI